MFFDCFSQAYLEVLAKNVDMPGDLCKISILNAITKVSKYLWKSQMLAIGAETLLGTLYQMLEQTNNPAVLKPIIEGFLYYANDESIFSQYFMVNRHSPFTLNQENLCGMEFPRSRNVR